MQYSNALKPLNITVSQYSLLKMIKRHQMISITHLAKECELERSTVGRNIKVLEKMNFIYFAAPENKNDQRENLIAVTEHGSRVLEEATRIWQSVQKEIEEKLGGEEKAKELLTILNSL